MAWNLLIYIYLHCLRSFSWCATTFDTLLHITHQLNNKRKVCNLCLEACTLKLSEMATQCLVTTGMFSLLKAWKMFPFHQNVLCYRNVSIYFLTKLSFVSGRKTGQLHNVFVCSDNIFNGLTWTFLTHILNYCKQCFKFWACMYLKYGQYQM